MSTRDVRPSQSLSAIWLGTAVALTTATQLRRPGIPVGPGELMLVGWIFASLVSVLVGDRLVVSSTGRAFLFFWTGSFVLLLAGWLVGVLTGHAADLAARDFLAYCLVATIVLLLAFKPGGLDEARVAGPVALFAATLALLLLLLTTFPFGSFGPISPWYGPRFRGWSENPNQVALVMSPVPFLALYQLRRSRRASARTMYILFLMGGIAVGIASFSDALRLAWLAGVVLMVSHEWLLGIARGRAPAGQATVRYMIVPMLAFGLLILGGHAVYLRIQDVLVEIFERRGQGSERLMLWRHGMEAMAESPLIGLGPGPHSGKSGPFSGFEAHNSFIDWGTATGVTGVLLLVGLLVWAGRRNAATPTLLASLAALVVVSVSGFNLRHPTFWLYLLFVAAVGREDRQVSRNRVPRVPVGGAAPPVAVPGDARSLVEGA
jgi:hypothetical protein